MLFLGQKRSSLCLFTLLFFAHSHLTLSIKDCLKRHQRISDLTHFKQRPHKSFEVKRSRNSNLPGLEVGSRRKRVTFGINFKNGFIQICNATASLMMRNKLTNENLNREIKLRDSIISRLLSTDGNFALLSSLLTEIQKHSFKLYTHYV